MSYQATVILGTRPELIKLAPFINLLGPDVLVIHTGQHNHEQMSARIAATFGIQLQHLTTRRDRTEACGAQLGGMVAALDRHLRTDPPAVVVQGDTTSALAANHADWLSTVRSRSPSWRRPDTGWALSAIVGGVSGVVYDAGALIAAERNDRAFWADHRVRLEQGTIPVTPAAVVAQVSRSPRQVPLRRLLRGCDVTDLDEGTAHRVGRILAQAGTADVVDGAVAAATVVLSAAVVTSDRDDITYLLQSASTDLPIIDV